jgi:hypothetical protein
MTKSTKVKIVTNVVKFVHVNLINPPKNKYSLTIVVLKTQTDNLKKLRSSFEEVIKCNLKFFGEDFNKGRFQILKDGDLTNEDDLKDSFYFEVYSKEKPVLIDENMNPIMDLDELYDGCLGRVSVTLSPYKTKNISGITCALNNIQKLKDS